MSKSNFYTERREELDLQKPVMVLNHLGLWLGKVTENTEEESQGPSPGHLLLTGPEAVEWFCWVDAICCNKQTQKSSGSNAVTDSY